ncbi:sodium:calcium antiporter [Nocardia sp. AB354]|uniref:sodium:calcium antiporter n=1 Tax=Nocardia sp. AB354 TaxID=3413283 RepID=UPI003C144F33
MAGLLVLTYAADQLVLGSARLARHLRISAAVVGVVVIGLGTSAPEFLVSGTAATTGQADIAIGNLMGSNIINVTLVLGTVAALGGVCTTATVIAREITLSVVAVALFAVAAAIGLTIWTGLALLALVVPALATLVHWSRSDRTAGPIAEQTTELTASDDRPSAAAHTWPESLGRAAAGLIGVLAGAQLLVSNAATIATAFGVPPLVIGCTLVALGTSLPELVTAIQAQRRGEADLLVGNLFGSNLFNSLAGGGIVGICSGTHTSPAADLPLLAVMVAASAFAWILLRRNLSIGRPGSIALLITYASTVPLLLTT